MDDKIISRILVNESGYVFDEDDPGGETKYGISKRSYPNLDIKNLSLGHAKMIYQRDFLDLIRKLGIVNDLILFHVLDFAVNSGLNTAIRCLQSALNVRADGVIGPRTLEALSESKPDIVVSKFTAERLDYLTKLPGWNKFGKGWVRRISNNLRFTDV